MKDLWQLKKEFLEHCEIEKGQSVLTIENYDRYVNRFLTWLDEEIKKPGAEPQNALASDPNNLPPNNLIPDAITEDRVRQYRLYINRLHAHDGGDLKLSTQNHHILALRAFLRYLLSRGILVLPPEKISLARTGDREINFMATEEYQRLLSAPNINAPEGLRDKAIIEILFSTGLRVSELTSIDIGDINFSQGEIAILGKGKKLRVVFLSDDALSWLTKYLDTRGAIKKLVPKLNSARQNQPEVPSPDKVAEPEPAKRDIIILEVYKDEPLFLSTRDNRMNSRAIERLVKKYSRIAGISKRVSPHTLRHTFATDLLSAGADIRSVQSLLGHSNISTTQVYTHVTDQHLREVHQRFHHRGNDSDDNAE